jgi:hypothetical protein
LVDKKIIYNIPATLAESPSAVIARSFGFKQRVAVALARKIKICSW